MNKRFVRFPTFIVLLFLLLIIPGCWNSRELDTISIVNAFGIDRTEDGQFSLTLEILKPDQIKEGSSQTAKSVWVVTSTGQTIFDALRNGTKKVERRPYFGHNRIVIIGEKAAQEGIAPLLDLYLRDPELRERVLVLIARGEARDILNAEHPQEKIPAKAIEGLVETRNATSFLPKVTLYDLAKVLVSPSSAALIPGIMLKERDEGTSVQRMKLDETAIFKEDKLIDWFDHQETRGVLWVLGEIDSGIVVVQSPLDNQKVALEIIRATREIEPLIMDDQLVVNVDVKVEGNLGEVMSHADLTKPETIKALEEREAEVILGEITSALRKAQELGIDPFQFGEEFHRKFPKEWPLYEGNWDEEVKKLKVNVSVEVNLLRVGTSIVSTNPNPE